MNEDEKKEIKNKIYKTEEGIDILKKPETIKEEVMNSIFLSNKKTKEEVNEDEIDELIKEYRKELKEKQNKETK